MKKKKKRGREGGREGERERERERAALPVRNDEKRGLFLWGGETGRATAKDRSQPRVVRGHAEPLRKF